MSGGGFSDSRRVWNQRNSGCRRFGLLLAEERLPTGGERLLVWNNKKEQRVVSCKEKGACDRKVGEPAVSLKKRKKESGEGEKSVLGRRSGRGN